MDVRILYFAGCPHWRLARDRLLQAAAQTGWEVNVETVAVQSEDDAEKLGFAGSPTILIEGCDPFPAAARGGLACRMYPCGIEAEGAPSVAQLQAALTRPRGER